MPLMLSSVYDGVLKEIYSLGDGDWTLVIVLDGPGNLENVELKTDRKQASELAPLLGKKVRITYEPRVEAR